MSDNKKVARPDETRGRTTPPKVPTGGGTGIQEGRTTPAKVPTSGPKKGKS
jgi:hypothetical protein